MVKKTIHICNIIDLTALTLSIENKNSTDLSWISFCRADYSELFITKELAHLAVIKLTELNNNTIIFSRGDLPLK